MADQDLQTHDENGPNCVAGDGAFWSRSTSAAGSAEPTLIGAVGDKNRFRFLEFLAARIKNPNRHWGLSRDWGNRGGSDMTDPVIAG